MLKKTLLFGLLTVVSLFSCQDGDMPAPQRTYRRVGVSDVRIIKYPPTKIDGSNWDGSLQGTYPDIYFKFVDLNLTTLYTIGTSNRRENLRPFDLPAGWSDPNGAPFYVFTSLTQNVFLELYDYESLGSDEFIGGVTINFSNYTSGSNKYPSTITVSDLSGQVTMRLSLIWLE